MKSIIFAIDEREDLLDGIVKSYQNNYNFSNVRLEKGKTFIKKFSDGELIVDFHTSLRGNIVYLLSSPNTSDKIMSLILAIDGAKRAAAKEINVILPYFPYARQDKKDRTRAPISAKCIASMVENAGAHNVITFDLHAEQIEGFFNIPVTHMEGKYLFSPYIAKMIGKEKNWCLCSPDAGGAKRVKQLRDFLKNKFGIDVPYVIIDKTRSKANVVDDMVLIGNVDGMNVLILDDICDTAGTLAKAANLLMEKEGANKVKAIITHGVLSGPALERIGESKLSELTLSDSLPFKRIQPEGFEVDIIRGHLEGQEKLNFLSLAGQISKAVFAINNGTSIEALKQRNE